MKIAYLINQYPKVSHSFIRREILSLEACGLEVERFSIRSCESELVDELDKQEVEKTHLILGVGIIRLVLALLQVALLRFKNFAKALKLTLQISRYSDRGILRHLAYLAEACVLLNWFKKLDITHVHAHFGTNSTTVAMLCQALGGPSYSFTVHGPEEFDKVQGIALEQKIQHATFVVAVSSFGKSQLYRWCDFTHWSKIHVIHCGVDELFLHSSYVPLPKEQRFVCVGRLSEQKGHLLLLEAVSRLASEGLQFQLILVGDGPLRSQIETFITQHHLQDYIQITGWASNLEVQQQILSSQILVLPSFAEGLPVVLMEALALSRPVISTYIAGIPELVKPNQTGWLVPSGSVNELANILRTVLQLPREALEEMGKAGAESVTKNHSAAIEAKKLADLFQTYASHFKL